MALSPYPTPSDYGVLCVILSNTVTSIAMIKEAIFSILHALGILHITPWEEISLEPTDSNVLRKSPTDSYMEEVLSLIPAKKPYASIFFKCEEGECPICLAEFEPKAEVNQLKCGHIFHTACLERWLKSWNSTCPLCRNNMVLMMSLGCEEEDNECPM